MCVAVCAERARRQPLVRHFCLESEAENLAKWCAEHHPRPAAFDARVAASRALREAGNAEFKKEDWSAAAWRYLAALHSVDFSEKDKVKAGVSGVTSVSYSYSVRYEY